ncbi:RNA pol II transcription cofactor [Conoideocrella luteorostrata]|uniref:RNA pol II transcription cofactor n=1 Tax=Conoideocrella luteorostrata TaxID=1105319 RepID=A0AAJ0CHG3_9HYPO|nr:RNA pol II transcription cofactor [Conoideocrella luteorostrata]
MKHFRSIITALTVGILSALILPYNHFYSLRIPVPPKVLNFLSITQHKTTPDIFQQPTQQNQHQQQQQHHLYATEMSTPRNIRKAFLAVEQSEGAGARVRRSIGTANLRNFSPFLMLDHFSIDPGAGFPDHPHRGQETITYLLEGATDHEDFAGNRGTLYPGDLQFMTAGRGIVHAEMPHDTGDGKPNVGLQLWVDLPEKLKSCEPRYRDLRASEIPSVEVDGGKAIIKVISGQSHGVDSVKDLAYTPVWIFDVILRPGAKVIQPVPQGWNTFSYVLEGNAWFRQRESLKKVEQYHNVVFEQGGDVIHVESDRNAEQNTRLVIIAGTPLDQQVVQHGPFVLSSKAGVYQALYDYQTFSNGFERARNWESEIGKPMRQ